MQSALDTTALNLSKTAQGLSTAQIDGQAQQVFNALFIRPEVQDVSATSAFSSPQQGNFVLNVTGSGTINTLFSKVIGHSQISFTAKSGVLWGIKKLNLAMALDNTGSMASNGKMTALKTAAHNLINTLKEAEKTPGDVKVSIIPSAVDVNAGACDNVKAANIRLYTVRVIDGNAELLKNCATNPNMYYDVDNAGDLNGVFSSIAQTLANLRIAR